MDSDVPPQAGFYLDNFGWLYWRCGRDCSECEGTGNKNHAEIAAFRLSDEPWKAPLGVGCSVAWKRTLEERKRLDDEHEAESGVRLYGTRSAPSTKAEVQIVQLPVDDSYHAFAFSVIALVAIFGVAAFFFSGRLRGNSP
jgi:hypothetical protein